MFINEVRHSKSALIYAFAYFFERASYYGVRTILVLYMIGETLKLSYKEALSIYAWFTALLFVSKILGALLGDLFARNKRIIIIGGFLQTFGCFTLCMQPLNSLYVGMGLIVLGSGFFTSNTLAEFGKQYLEKPKLLDAGFSLLFVAINFGALLGVLVIGDVADLGFTYGFLVGGILMLLATVFIYLINENSEEIISSTKEVTLSKKLFYVFAVILFSGFFWIIYEISYYGIYEIQQNVFDNISMPKMFIDAGFGSVFGMFVILILTIVWTYIYTNSFFKIFIGLVVSTLSFVVLLFISESNSTFSLILFMLSTFFLSCGEMLISPILYSVTTRFSNPKYLAILLALVTLPSTVFNKVSGLLAENFIETNFDTIIYIGISILIILAIVAYALVVLSKKEIGIYLSKETKEFLS